MGRRTCLVGSVGWAFFFFFISGIKNYPKNTKISKKIWHFLQKKFWENIAKIFRVWSKKWLILQDFGKIKKKKRQICQNRKCGSVVPYIEKALVFTTRSTKIGTVYDINISTFTVIADVANTKCHQRLGEI